MLAETRELESRTVDRARQSAGSNDSSRLFELVREILKSRSKGGVAYDVGCGTGSLQKFLKDFTDSYVGVDVVQHTEFKERGMTFLPLDLEQAETNLPVAAADVVCCLETIEHVENPRSLMRGLVRLSKPHGLLLVSTPNQLSLLSKLGLVLKNEFVHFQERPGLYPAHISALLEIDLIRLAHENGLGEVEIRYSGEGRIPGTKLTWPSWLTSTRGWRGRAFSDNVLLIARKAKS